MAKLWAENIVDDVSLAARLVRAGSRWASPVGASLRTPLDHETLAGWQDWLIRQWLYLKFCMPATWLAGGLLVHLVVALVVLAGVRLLLLPLGAVAAGPALAGARSWRGSRGWASPCASYHPATRPPGEMVAGLLCGPRPGQLVPPEDPVYPGDALAGDYLPGRLARQGGGDSEQ